MTLIRPVLLLVILSTSVFADQPEYQNRVTEIKTCASIMTVLGDHSLHIQDLDATIMKPAQMLGSDPWYRHHIKDLVASGLTDSDAHRENMKKWMRIQSATKMIPVEDFIPNMITFLIQGRDHLRAVALTARAPDMADITLRQLASLKIDFAKRNPFGGKKEIWIRSSEFAEPILIKGGVIFSGHSNRKGRVLAYLLDPKNGLNSYSPGFERVVFADDKTSNVVSVLQDMNAHHPQIHVYAFRDGAADIDEQFYDPKIAQIQWNEFEKTGVIISDEDARKLLSLPATPTPVNDAHSTPQHQVNEVQK